MADINTTISVDVTGAGELTALAEAADKAAAALDKLQESAGKGFDIGAAGAGADKLAASYEAAFAKIQAGMDKLNASMADLGKAGGGSDAAAASVAKLEDAEKAATEQADAMAASVAKADDSLKGLGGTADAGAASVGKLDDSLKGASETSAGLKDTAAGAADGLKGIGAGADMSAAQMADFNKVMADSAALTADTAKVSADASLAMARSSAVQADAKTYMATSSIEQDAAMAQSAKVTQAAHEDAAAQAEATAGKYHMLALGGAAALAVGIDMAAKLQTSVTRLYTTAGESAANLPMMSAGILALSGQTNTSQAQLGQGAYMVESAGFHGQSALNVLKAAAEGAQSEGAPLGDTANALTSLLNAYGMKGAGAPMSAMDQIIAMVSRGKMTMASAVSALPDVLPAASAAKLSFADVGGALSTMTSMGVSPDRAAQNLSHVITSIMNPNAVQTKEQQQLGLNPVQIENDLGKQGLTGTLTELSGTVMKQMGPAGDVLFKTFNQSQSAAKDANTMIAAMPSSIRSTAQAYADGTVSAAQWNQEMFKGSESAQQKNMLQQFATVENTAKGFNDLLKAGSPDVQTYAAAMDKLLGGQTGLNVAMELTGQHMPVMKANTDAIAAAARNAGDNVTGWSKVQGTLNFQLGSFAKSAEAVATEAGQIALPAVTGLLKGLGDVGGFLASNPALSKAVTAGAGILGAGLVIPKLASVGTTAVAGVGKIAETLHIPGLSGLSNIGKSAGLDTAASGLTGAAGSLDGAAASLEGAAASLKGDSVPGVPGGKPGKPGEPGGPVSTGEKVGAGATETAEDAAATAAERTAPFSLGMLNPVGIGIAGGVFAAMYANQFKKYDHPAPASQQGPRSAGQPAGASTAWQQYDQITPPAGKQWTSVLPAPAANVPASRFAAPPPQMVAVSVPAGPESRFTGPQMAPNEPSVPMLGAGARPSTVEIKPKIEPPDLGSFTAMLSQAMHVTPIKLPPPDVSAVKSAGAQVQSALTAIEAVHPKPIKIPAPDMSALKAAAGAASAAGASAGAGFAAGIAGEAGAVEAAASALAADAASAMHVTLKSASPSKVTEKIGADFDAGFSQGIIGNASSAKAASAQIGSDSVASLLQGLAGGQSNIQNAIQAVMGAASNPDAVTSIQQTIQTLIGDVPAKDTALVTYLTGQQSKLTALANKQGAIEAQITDAQQLATSAISGAGITSAVGYTPALAASNGPQASQSILTGMQQQLADTKSFAATLTQLQKGGLNATTESQLAQAGTAAGLPLAEGLAQGGKGAIQQMNAIQAQIIKESQQIGSVGGTAMEQAGLQVAKGLDAPLKAELTTLDKDMTKIANSIIKTVQKDLGTKAASAASSSSSSTAASATTAASAAGTVSVPSLGSLGTSAAAAASGLGKTGTEGGAAAAGLGSVASAAGSAASALGKIVSVLAPLSASQAQPLGGGGYSAHSSGGGSSGASVQPIHVNVHLDGQQIATSVQNVQIAQAAQNWQSSPVPLPNGRRS